MSKTHSPSTSGLRKVVHYPLLRDTARIHERQGMAPPSGITYAGAYPEPSLTRWLFGLATERQREGGDPFPLCAWAKVIECGNRAATRRAERARATGVIPSDAALRLYERDWCILYNRGLLPGQAGPPIKQVPVLRICAKRPRVVQRRRESHAGRPGHRRVRSTRAGPDDDPGSPSGGRRRSHRRGWFS